MDIEELLRFGQHVLDVSGFPADGKRDVVLQRALGRFEAGATVSPVPPSIPAQAQAPAEATVAPGDLRLVLRHACKHRACAGEDCGLCRNSVRKRCEGAGLQRRYLVGQRLLSGCGGEVEVCVIVASTGAAPPASMLEGCSLEVSPHLPPSRHTVAHALSAAVCPTWWVPRFSAQLRVVDAKKLITAAATEAAGEQGSQSTALHLLETAAIRTVPEARPAGRGGSASLPRWCPLLADPAIRCVCRPPAEACALCVGVQGKPMLVVDGARSVGLPGAPPRLLLRVSEALGSVCWGCQQAGQRAEARAACRLPRRVTPRA